MVALQLQQCMKPHRTRFPPRPPFPSKDLVSGLLAHSTPPGCNRSLLPLLIRHDRQTAPQDRHVPSARDFRKLLLLSAVVHAYMCEPAAARFTSKPRPCDFPAQPSFPQRPSCPPTTLTRADAAAMAWRCAPCTPDYAPLPVGRIPSPSGKVSREIPRERWCGCTAWSWPRLTRACK